MDRDREYAEYRTKLLAMGFDEAEVDQVVEQMRLEDESKKYSSESRQKAAQRTVEDD